MARGLLHQQEALEKLMRTLSLLAPTPRRLAHLTYEDCSAAAYCEWTTLDFTAEYRTGIHLLE